MRAVRWSTLKKARDFFRAGGIVIAGAALPEASDRAGRDDPQLDQIVKDVFGASAVELASGGIPSVQHSDADGTGIAVVPSDRFSARQYEGGFVGRWAWSKEPVQNVYFKAVWRGSKATCRVRFFCDNQGDLYLNDRQLCAAADYGSGWNGEVVLQEGDVITVDAHDQDAPGKRGTAGMFLAITQNGKTLLSTEGLRYTTAAPGGDSWRTSRDITSLTSVDTMNVHPLHRGAASGDVGNLVLSQIEKLVPRDVQSSQPIKAAHRKVGPRDVYMVMGAAKKSHVVFRAKGCPELWDPWTGETRPLRVLGETATSTEVEMPLEDYEAQMVVFTPAQANQPVVSAETTAKDSADDSAEVITLAGEWEFGLKPTMDNRFGDFRLPATETMIGPEARIFRHAVQRGDTSDWHQPSFDDSQWQRVTYDFGPQFWLLGPMPDDTDAVAIEQELSKLTQVNPAQPVNVSGQTYRWRPYNFSWRFGLEGDPGHQGFHGLKKHVTDHFLCLGRRANAMNEFKYVAEETGSRYYLWTSATVDQATTARIAASARHEGEQPHASDVLTPATVFVNSTLIKNLDETVLLRTGKNPVLVRYDHAGRGYFVLKQDNPKSKPSVQTPLSMSWLDNPSIIRFDVYAGVQPDEWFRFTAPPGLKSIAVAARGTVKAWAEGQPMRETDHGRFEASTPLPQASIVSLRVMPEIGFSGAAVFPEPIKLDCQCGLTLLGDWSRTSALQCYSGGAWYRKTVALTAQQASGSVSVDLGNVVATAEVHVNGRLAGIRVAPPWRVDISKQVKAGENRIEVLIFNTLANHYQTIPTHYRGSTTSGLLGPVQLKIGK